MRPEDVVAIVKKEKWNIQGFNAYPLYLCTAGNASGRMVKEILGVEYRHFFTLFQNGRARYHYDESDWLRISDAYDEHIHTRAELDRLMQRYADAYALQVTNAALPDPAPASAEELVRSIQRQIPRLTYSVGSAHAIEGITFGAERKLRDVLTAKNAFDELVFSTLCSPTSPSFLWSAQRIFVEIKMASEGERQARAERFLSEFSWTENSYIGSAKLTIADVLKRAAQLEHAPSISEFEETASEKEKIMRRLSFSDRERFIVETIDRCFKWQDDRKMHILQSIEVLDPTVGRLAEALYIDSVDLKYTLPKEITLPRMQSPEFLKELASRRAGCAVYSVGDDFFVFTNGDFSYIVSELHETLESGINELRGTVACKGIVRGIVRVCESVSDIGRVQNGEILVASMTRPEYLPAMQRAAAFITDEGGVTSHAAIISRELKKPCIIGTKIATQVLKDGDMVEVDADEGIVRILERAT